MHESTHIFEARTEGYWNYRVPGIVALDSGMVLASVEARRGRGGDWDGNDILLRRSPDGGRSWLPRQTIAAQADWGEGPTSNFAMIPDGPRVVGLFCHNYARVFRTISTDEGASWSAPVEVTQALLPLRGRYLWRVIATGPGHGLRHSSGRLIVPLWMSTGEGTEFGPGKLGHRPSAVSVMTSDDHGESWQAGEVLAEDGVAGVRNPSETVAVELSDGRVLLNIRHESPHQRRLVSLSADGRTAWSPVRHDEALLEPVCMASLLRLRGPGPRGTPWYVFVNPDNLENTITRPGSTISRDRKRLTAKLSCDDCASWTSGRVLEPGPAGYSDLAQAPDGTILCIHEDGMLEHMYDSACVTVRRFDLDWVLGG